MQGKVALRSAILSSTDEAFLLSQVASLSEQVKAGSAFSRQVLFLLSQSTALESVRNASANALKES